MTNGQRPDPDQRRWLQVTQHYLHELYDTIATLRLELAVAQTEIRELKDRLRRQ